MIELDHLFDVRVTLAPMQDLGDTPVGRRRIIGITGGSFSGPKLRGTVLPGGADWQHIRADGTAVLDARYTLQTDDGALIYVNNWGYRHGPADVIERLAHGEEVDPASYYFRTTPRFETAAPKYAWLNSVICVATAIRRPEVVELSVYEIK